MNGNTNLATAKQNVQQAIDQLPNLNQAQRDEYNKQITQATLVPNVNAIQQAATTLNDAMTQLKQGIMNKAQIKGVARTITMLILTSKQHMIMQ